MKPIKLIVLALCFFVANALQAQVSVSVNISPPAWGPVGVTNVTYYYLPDVEAFYDVPSAMFIFVENGVWVHRSLLPPRYRGYDLYKGYKVTMNDYRGNTPNELFKAYKSKYAKGYHGPAQKTNGVRPQKGNTKATTPHQAQPKSAVQHNNKPQQKGASNGNKGGGSGKGGGKGKK